MPRSDGVSEGGNHRPAMDSELRFFNHLIRRTQSNVMKGNGQNGWTDVVKSMTDDKFNQKCLKICPYISMCMCGKGMVALALAHAYPNNRRSKKTTAKKIAKTNNWPGMRWLSRIMSSVPEVKRLGQPFFHYLRSPYTDRVTYYVCMWKVSWIIICRERHGCREGWMGTTNNNNVSTVGAKKKRNRWTWQLNYFLTWKHIPIELMHSASLRRFSINIIYWLILRHWISSS